MALRPAGLAGLVVVAGGVLAAGATFVPWANLVARLTMLGVVDDRVVARLTGMPTTPTGWIAFLCGIVAAVVGVLVVLDRPSVYTRLALWLATVSLATAAVVGLLATPDVQRVAGDQAATLLATTQQLPVGLTLELTVVRGAGPWLALTAAVAIVAGTAAMAE